MIRPRISVNVALSTDGKISSAGNRPADWTSPADKERFRRLRQGADALLVGRGTWQTDRMTMRVRDASPDCQPLRCVVSSSGKFDPAHPMFAAAGGPIHLLVTGAGAPPEPNFGSAEVTVHQESLGGFLTTLATRYRAQTLHCEGGGQLIHALLELDAVDEFHATFCGHTIFGGSGAPTATGKPGEWLPSSRTFRLVRFEPSAESGECFLSYERVR